ncbi:MAG: hypothetical protein SynsKO_11650 [Synoicihabitans sp.]
MRDPQSSTVLLGMKSVFAFVFLFFGLINLQAEHHGEAKELPACCSDGCCCTGADVCTGCACTKDLAAHGDTTQANKNDPVTVCVVSGEDLGSMGEPVAYTHKVDGKADVEVMFCCKRCVNRFKADPDKYLSKLNEDAEACCAEGQCSAH